MVQMWREFFEAVEFYELFRSAPIPRKAIENPIMHDHARECLGQMNRQIVQPWWFGDPTFKATGWELIGLPKLTPTNKLTPPKPGTEEHKEWSWVHRMSPGPERERERSRFHQGMAAAIAQQWGEEEMTIPENTPCKNFAFGVGAGSNDESTVTMKPLSKDSPFPPSARFVGVDQRAGNGLFCDL